MQNFGRRLSAEQRNSDQDLSACAATFQHRRRRFAQKEHAASQAGVNDVALATSDSGTDSLGITELQIAIAPLMKQDAPANASVWPKLESGSSTNAA